MKRPLLSAFVAVAVASLSGAPLLAQSKRDRRAPGCEGRSASTRSSPRSRPPSPPT